MKIVAIKTNKGFYVSEATRSGTRSLARYLFDGQPPSPSFHRDWVVIPSIPSTVEKKVLQPATNHRYELRDPTLASDRIPAVIDKEGLRQVDGAWVLRDEYREIAPLYKHVWDTQPDTWEPVEFTFEIILEVEEIKQPGEFSYSAITKSGEEEITQDDIEHQLLDRILFPEIILHTRPCRLSSRQAYNIVRQYVRQHINLDVAVITADYDFCFAVKKRIALQRPFTRKKEILNARGKRYKKPRYREVYVKERLAQVLEMTYSPLNYRGYTPIREFVGENQDDLKRQIDEYCAELIEIINTPLQDCPLCNGMGVIEARTVKQEE